MKTKLTLLPLVLVASLLACTTPVKAQVDPTSPGISHVFTDVWNFMKGDSNTVFNATSLDFAAGPNYHDNNLGFSAFVAYPLTPYIKTGLGLDYIDKVFYESSFQTQLGTSFKLLGKLDVHPYVTAGVGYAFTGPDAKTGSAIAIVGAGSEIALPIKLSSTSAAYFSIAGEVDHYSIFSGPVVKGFLKFTIPF